MAAKVRNSPFKCKDDREAAGNVDSRLSGHAAKFIGGIERGVENTQEGGGCEESAGVFLSAPLGSVCCDDTRLMKEVNA